MSERKRADIAQMCLTHQKELIRAAKFMPKDPWQVFIIVAQLGLFTKATQDRRTELKIGDDVSRVGELGCLACWLPAAFKEILVVAKKGKVNKLKSLVEQWRTGK